MKSDEKHMFDNRHRDLETYNKIYGQSTNEIKMFAEKGRSEHAKKMLS